MMSKLALLSLLVIFSTQVDASNTYALMNVTTSRLSQILPGAWHCRYTNLFIGDKVLDEYFQFQSDGTMSSIGEFTYYLPREDQNAQFSFQAKGYWEYDNKRLLVKYEPFEVLAKNKFSHSFLAKIEKFYAKNVKKSYKGTRLLSLTYSDIQPNSLIFREMYDTWSCSR
ncbi:hypothetical protein [Vibrio sp. 16]|uniref:hypothetical protein n=1 Tax=Vibrio sp. 16 TaxID=391586 RepID=UPI0005C6F11C|nr:hypothetical protein [Vibrio sp. 16]CAK4076538.1 hypothetical protein PVDT1_23 [Vibrio sp. 16]